MSVELIGAHLEQICPGGVQSNLSLALISRWRIGGPADFIVEPRSVEQLCALRKYILVNGLPSIIIGDTSNLLFADEGIRGVCIRLGSKFSKVSVRDTEVLAQAGVWVPFLARRVMQHGLTGAEHICGIPGTIGGLTCMNGGSQRLGIGSNIVSVKGVTDSGDLVEYYQQNCHFGYRKSIFQTTNIAISTVKLNFSRAFDKTIVRRKMLDILRSRRRKFPRKYPNCGSVFKSNPAMYSAIGPPGAALENLGLKGHRIGNAMISHDHANFFINTGNASSRDMLNLIHIAWQAVYKQYGYSMEVEVRYVSSQGRIIPITPLSTPRPVRGLY